MSARSSRRAAPRPLAEVLGRVMRDAAPATTLARVQACWADVAGAVIAAEAQPSAERAGVVTVACSSAVWAAELELLSARLVAGLNGALGGHAVRSLRFITSRGITSGNPGL